MNILQNDLKIGPMGPLIATIILGVTAFLLLLWYSTRNYDYWKKRCVLYVKPYPFFGSMLENLCKPIHDVELDRYKKYGRIYGHFEGNRPVLSVGDVEVLRNILVKDFPAFNARRDRRTGAKITDNMIQSLEGEDWKRVRTIVTPTFTTGKIKRMIGIFRECSRVLANNFKEAAKNQKSINAKSLFGAFTMDVIASSAFSTKLDSHNDPNNEFVSIAKHVFTPKVNWRLFLLALHPGLMKLFKVSIFTHEGLQFFADVTLQIIEERKRTGQTRNDFLQLLIDTAKEVSEEGKLDSKETENDIIDNYGKDESEMIFKNAVSKKSLSLDELISQCVIFFLAGYETTASTLSSLSYLLALNPSIQEKLIQEVDEALRDCNGDLTYEALQKMKTLDNVISETLRLFPPAVRLERRADKDYVIKDVGITIPKGMVITIPIYAMHRDPEYFPEPEKFNPDRFSAEERAKRNPYTFMPFGAGPRNCIGMRFALMEMKVCLAYILSNFRFKKCAETKVPLDYSLGQSLLTPKDVTLQVEIRSDTVKAL